MIVHMYFFLYALANVRREHVLQRSYRDVGAAPRMSPLLESSSATSKFFFRSFTDLYYSSQQETVEPP